MTYKKPECLGHYNFEHIVRFARMRYVEGCSTINLLQQVDTDIEREEVALVCMLDIEDDVVTGIELNCRHSRRCQVQDCRDRLRYLIEASLRN